MGRISFAGARFLRKVHRKMTDGKTIALFFTSGGPDEDHWKTEETGPRKIKEIMFETMERLLTVKKKVTILEERFYCKGAIRIPKKAEPKHNIGHPSEEELAQAKEFGEMLKAKFEI